MITTNDTDNGNDAGAPPDGTDTLSGAPNYSNAQNFLSHMQTGVDPRTGDFTCAFSLPALEANALCGPTLQMGLGFSGQLLDNLGYGIGWALSGLSSYQPGAGVLSLATGERFVSDYTGGEFTFKDRKLVTFHMRRDATVPGVYWITHKSGVVEKLSTLGGAAQVAVPVEIRSPEGRRVFLEFSAQASPRLQRVRDETSTLLQITRNGSQSVEIVLHPDKQAPATFRLGLSNDRLTSVALPVENNAAWRLQYEQHHGIYFVNRVDLPTGGFETVKYQSQGHRCLAGAPTAWLPYVVEHTRNPGRFQPPIRTTYSYTGQNYLGYGTGLQWQPNQDNLYRVVTPAGQPYLYGSTATMQATVDGVLVVRTVESRFNRLHLQTLERTIQNGHVLEKATEYHDDPTLGFSQQKPYFQLPRRTETQWYLASADKIRRIDTVLTDYDDHGNLIRQQDETGLVEERTYYPAEGGDGCPADPHGFVRSLKALRAVPMAGRGDGAAIIETRYRYKALPSLLAGDAPFLVMTDEAKVALQGGTEVDLGADVSVYVEEAGDAHFGRVREARRLLNGKMTSTAYAYAADAALLSVRQTVTGHDGTQRYGVEKQSLVNGLTVHEKDDEGSTVDYQFDALGRVVMETASAGTPFAAKRRTAYRLALQAGDDVYVETTDVANVRVRVHLDGLGREISGETEDIDHAPGTFRQTWTRTWNAIGDIAEETTTDWVAGVQRPTLSRVYRYDHWGQQAQVLHSNGTRDITEADPITLIEKSWKEDGAGGRTGGTVAHGTVFGKPERIDYIDAAGRVQASTSYVYDGIGRCVATTDRLGRETRHVYDAFDRVVESTLPDGAVVATRYAEHSGDELPVEVAITHPGLGGRMSVGEQAFDGLSRRVSYSVGGRTSRFVYEGGALRPSRQTTPLEEVVTYTYEPRLGMQLVGRTDTTDSTYTYDPRHAKLTHSARNGLEKTLEYYNSGLLKLERWKNEAGAQHEARHTYSLDGRSQSYTDVFGVKQVVTYDEHDRPKKLQHEGIATELDYDSFSRVNWIKAWQGLHSMLTTLVHDDFGREKERHFTASAIGGQTVSQVLTMEYTVADQLERRTLKQAGATVRDESFEYDNRGRLVVYTCSGTQLPSDPWGKPINRQAFTFDAFDRIRSITTDFPGGQNETTYVYAETDPAQLTRLTHSHSDYPQNLPDLKWDGAGRMVKDERGRALEWNAQNQLTAITVPAA